MRRISCDKCGKRLLEGDPNRMVLKAARGQSNRSKALADLCHGCSVLMVDFVVAHKGKREEKRAENAPRPVKQAR